MKLSRTTTYNFGWLLLVGLVDLAFLLAFFLLLSSNFILQQGISISMPVLPVYTRSEEQPANH